MEMLIDLKLWTVFIQILYHLNDKHVKSKVCKETGSDTRKQNVCVCCFQLNFVFWFISSWITAGLGWIFLSDVCGFLLFIISPLFLWPLFEVWFFCHVWVHLLFFRFWAPSPLFPEESGVPQGSLSGPSLLNLLLNRFQANSFSLCPWLKYLENWKEKCLIK